MKKPTSPRPSLITHVRVVLLPTLALALSSCATSTLAPTVDPKLVTQIVIGQTKAEVEKIMGRSVGTFTMPFKPNEFLQAWSFDDGQDRKCLLITYDQNARATDVAIMIKERGRHAMPLPGGC